MQSQNNTNLRVIVKPETLCTSTFLYYDRSDGVDVFNFQGADEQRHSLILPLLHGVDLFQLIKLCQIILNMYFSLFTGKS